MNQFKRLIISIATLLLVACAAVGVPATSDPAQKLRYAQELFEELNRPIPAERLIREAEEIYRNKGDELGLALVYRMYGLFYKSRAVTQYKDWYLKNDFPDKSVHYETRYQKALEYFEQSRSLLEKNGDAKWITNIYAQKAFTYELMNNKEAACKAYDQALTTSREIYKAHPELITLGSREFPDFERGIVTYKKRLGCNS